MATKYSFGRAGDTTYINGDIIKKSISSITNIPNVGNTNGGTPEITGVQNNYLYTGNAPSTTLNSGLTSSYGNIRTTQPPSSFPLCFLSGNTTYSVFNNLILNNW